MIETFWIQFVGVLFLSIHNYLVELARKVTKLLECPMEALHTLIFSLSVDTELMTYSFLNEVIGHALLLQGLLLNQLKLNIRNCSSLINKTRNNNLSAAKQLHNLSMTQNKYVFPAAVSVSCKNVKMELQR